jgi:hypothetical protein
VAMTVTSYAIPDFSQHKTIRTRSYRFGNGTISGTVKVGNVAIQCRVFLFEYPNMTPIDMQLTDISGNYSFKFLDVNYKYAVTAQHPTSLYNGVIAVNVTPV